MDYDWLPPQRHEIERWAYELWEKRGRPFGSPDIDWFQAQAMFLRHFGLPAGLPLSSLATEPIEW